MGKGAQKARKPRTLGKTHMTLTTLHHLRTKAAGLSPRAARITLALLPRATRAPDAWQAALNRTLDQAAHGCPPLTDSEVHALAEAMQPADLHSDPDHTAAWLLMVDVRLDAEQQRLATL